MCFVPSSSNVSIGSTSMDWKKSRAKLFLLFVLWIAKISLYMYQNCWRWRFFVFFCMFLKHRMVSKFVHNAQSVYHLMRNNIEEKQRQTNSLWLYSQSCAQWAQFYLCFRVPGYHPCISRKLKMKQTELPVTYYSDVTFKIEAREAFQWSLW